MRRPRGDSAFFSSAVGSAAARHPSRCSPHPKPRCRAGDGPACCRLPRHRCAGPFPCLRRVRTGRCCRHGRRASVPACSHRDGRDPDRSCAPWRCPWRASCSVVHQRARPAGWRRYQPMHRVLPAELRKVSSNVSWIPPILTFLFWFSPTWDRNESFLYRSYRSLEFEALLLFSVSINLRKTKNLSKLLYYFYNYTINKIGISFE